MRFEDLQARVEKSTITVTRTYLWWRRYGDVCPRQMPRRDCLELRESRHWLAVGILCPVDSSLAICCISNNDYPADIKSRLKLTVGVASTITKHALHTVCPEKETKMFLVMSSIKLGRFWWNLVNSFLNKLAANTYKRFPPHLNNVSILPCETSNPHHAGATTALSEKETPEFILWSPNSPDLNPVDYSVWEYCKRRCTKHASLMWMANLDATVEVV